MRFRRGLWKELRFYLEILLLVISVCFALRLYIFGMLPKVYYVIIMSVLLLLNAGIWLLMFRKNGGEISRMIGKAFSFLLSCLLVIALFGIEISDSLLNHMTENTVLRKDISIIVMNESPIKVLSDFSESDLVGAPKTMYAASTEFMYGELEKQHVTVKPETFDSLNPAAQALYDGQISAIILDESYRSFVEEVHPDFNKETRVIHSVTYEVKQQNISKKIDVTEDTFSVLISGIDTYGSIGAVSRSDVNILAVVNPRTAQVLLVSIPRDYYVPIMQDDTDLESETKKMDKLTHSGLFGTQCTVRTLENLFDIPINYYVKVNFSSVVEIVDAIGGITVQSDYAFGEFEKGANTCNGEQALIFARERHSFQDGDRQRGRNQMKVIEGIVQKVSNPSLSFDYWKLLETVQSSIEMNFSNDEVKSLIQYQIEKMPLWSIESTSVNGSDGHDFSAFYGDNVYVMYPDQNSIEAAKTKMKSYYENGVK